MSLDRSNSFLDLNSKAKEYTNQLFDFSKHA